jgi:hypothetical protein
MMDPESVGLFFLKVARFAAGGAIILKAIKFFLKNSMVAI